MAKQLAFLVDTTKCIACNACRVACQVNNELPAQIPWRRVTRHQSGTFPDVQQIHLSLACNHCADPACRQVCPVGAIHKRPQDGVVFIDEQACNGCQRCVSACPYSAPRIAPAHEKVSKCNFCMSRLDRQLPPHCVETCVGGALQFAKIDQLPNLVHGKTLHTAIDGFPDPQHTRPSIRFIKR